MQQKPSRPTGKRASLQSTGKGMLFLHAQAWEDIGRPMTAEQWVKALQLPPEYQIIYIRRRINILTGEYGRFEMVVAHEKLPRDIPIARLEVRPLYARDEKKQVVLDRVDFWHWDGHQHHLLFSDERLKGGA